MKSPVLHVLLASFSASSLLASPVITEFTGPGPIAPFSVLNNDLLQTSVSSVSSGGNFSLEGSGGVTALTNGAFLINGGNPSSSNAELATAGNGGGAGTFVQYDLNLTLSPLGYQITDITTYGGWNDGGRDQQNFTITYSQVASPSVFLGVDSVNYNPAGTSNPSAVRAQFPVSLGTVASIRFDFGAVENGYTGYGEIDVVGTAVVPEPASGALLGLGAVLALRFAKKRLPLSK
jgi:hypothetical protein